eukprot:snap_masked-scaffold_48-processed-gene-1.121-mRNA-1 protein AED:1.00 eAED:1.00 QI:0/-1/0/0/-1/1/1/0/474
MDENRCFKTEISKHKGRVLIATRDLHIGEVILIEPPLVYSSWEETVCVTCYQDHSSLQEHQLCVNNDTRIPTYFRKNLDSLAIKLVSEDIVDDLDKSRNLLLLLSLYWTHLTVAQTPQSSAVFNLVQTLEDYALENIKPCKASFRKIEPFIMGNPFEKYFISSDRDVALAVKLLSLLNTHSHTIESLGGSGFFLTGCIFEHSCKPNCNYVTNIFPRVEMVVCVIEEIKKGENLSLDYIESFYKPKELRKSLLREGYAFECNCVLCNGIEYERTFICSKCRQRSYLVPNKIYALLCIQCGNQDEFLEKEDNIYCSKEEEIIEHNSILEEITYDLPPLSEMKSLLKGLLYEEHYLYFQYLEIFIHKNIEDIDLLTDMEKEEVYSEYCYMIKLMHSLAGKQKRSLVHIMVNFYDELAQLAIKIGKVPEGQQWFKRAYELSKHTSGDETVCNHTKSLKLLVDMNIETIEDLLKYYNAS